MIIATHGALFNVFRRRCHVPVNPQIPVDPIQSHPPFIWPEVKNTFIHVSEDVEVDAWNILGHDPGLFWDFPDVSGRM